jgi:hypothetical protein
MLPPETLRFFYLDANWTAALLDGALSIGLQSSRDTVFQQAMRAKLHQAVGRVVPEVRAALRGGQVAGVQPTSLQLTGLLLRSVAVAAWPGLEVRGYANSQLLTPLRLDRVAPDVLLVIFPALPDTVDIQEPSEGLVFGFTGISPQNEGLALRYLPQHLPTGPVLGSPTGVTIPLSELNDQSQRKGGDNLPYNVATHLVSQLAGKLPGGDVVLTPASLAVQLVRAPEHLLLTRPATSSN